MSYEGGQPRSTCCNIETGQREVVGNFPGMTFAPRFSPDGQHRHEPAAQDGNSNIYTMDLRSRATTRLTELQRHRHLALLFAGRQQDRVQSDRGGASRSTSWTPTAATRGASRSATALLDAGLVAARRPDRLHQAERAAVPDRRDAPDGSGERILSTGFSQEGPTWAPNGRVLMFFREPAGAGGPRLHSIDLTGRNEQAIPSPELRLRSGLVAAARLDMMPTAVRRLRL
jgi:TolB protein